MTKQEYQKAINWLFVQMPNYQNQGIGAYKPGLENITKLCEYFNNPHKELKMVHIAGTNGKGSTSNMLSSVLQEEGYKVGLYNSPHLIDFTERVKVNNENIDKRFVFDFIEKLKNLSKNIKSSFFEFTTIMAFEYFKTQRVDFAIIETGLGGRLDSTNIISPILTAITNVDLDHTNILGNSIEKITHEKAGIIKPNVPVIIGDEKHLVKNIIEEKAKNLNSKFVDATNLESNLKSDLIGLYQKNNIKVVQGLVNELNEMKIKVSENSLKDGLMNVQENTGFIGRWFEFSKTPLTICDTAHNKAGLEQVFLQLKNYPNRKHIILGFVNDKNINEITPTFPKNEKFYFVKPHIERGKDPREYENLLKKEKMNYQIFNDVKSGYIKAIKDCKSDELIFIGGSNFVVGDFLAENLKVY